jgi:uncharacterized protein YxjI
MKEKVWSLSGDTFHIVDQNGHEVVQCRGKAFSLSDRKEFADSSGRPLFSLRTRHFSLHKSFYAEDASGRTLFEVKGKFSCELKERWGMGREVLMRSSGRLEDDCYVYESG